MTFIIECNSICFYKVFTNIIKVKSRMLKGSLLLKENFSQVHRLRFNE